MLNLSLLSEAAALAGYTITAATGQDVINKARAQRRVNIIKTDIISRFGGKWQANYKEGWLPLVPLYTDGTADFTIDSRTVSGTSTTWTSAMKGRKILGPDGAYYKIASVTSATSLVLTQPFQGVTVTGASYQIWKDEYTVYPDALSLGGFTDYSLQSITSEAWPRNMKESFAKPSAVDAPSVHTVIGQKSMSAVYSTGTVSATINTSVWTGVGTAWLSNIEPGYEFTVGSYKYHVRSVNSDTELETYQLAVATVSATTYTSVGKNAIIVRFKGPTTQRIVNYWYWGKDYPFVNDNDEDWIAEQYPKVLINGLTFYDYLDKSDSVRADRSSIAYENSIKDMKVATDNAFTGVRTLGYYFPSDARE